MQLVANDLPNGGLCGPRKGSKLNDKTPHSAALGNLFKLNDKTRHSAAKGIKQCWFSRETKNAPPGKSRFRPYRRRKHICGVCLMIVFRRYTPVRRGESPVGGVYWTPNRERESPREKVGSISGSREDL